MEGRYEFNQEKTPANETDEIKQANTIVTKEENSEDTIADLTEEFGKQELTEIDESLYDSEEEFTNYDQTAFTEFDESDEPRTPPIEEENVDELEQSAAKAIIESSLDSNDFSSPKKQRRKEQKLEQAEFTETFDEAECVKRVNNIPYLKNVERPLKNRESIIRHSIEQALKSVDTALGQAEKVSSRQQELSLLKNKLAALFKDANDKVKESRGLYDSYLTILKGNLRVAVAKRLMKEAKKHNPQKKKTQQNNNNVLPKPRKRKTIKQKILFPFALGKAMGATAIHNLEKEIGLIRTHKAYVKSLIQFEKTADEIIAEIHAAEVPYLPRNIKQKAKKQNPSQFFSTEDFTMKVDANKEAALKASKVREEKNEEDKKDKVAINSISGKKTP